MRFWLQSKAQDLIDASARGLRSLSPLLKTLDPRVSGAIDMIRMKEPPKRGAKQILEIYSHSPWVQAVTRKIGERVASTEWRLFVQTGKPNDKALSIYHSQSIARKIQRSGLKERARLLGHLKAQNELREIINHPLLDLLADGNPALSGTGGRFVTQISRDLVGEAFWALGRNIAGAPDEFWPFPPTWVTGLPGPGNETYTLNISGQTFSLPASDVIWFREPNPANPYSRGTGLGMALGDEIEIDEYAAKFIKMFFVNRAKPEIMIYADGIDTAELRVAKLDFENSHRGYNRAHRSWWYNTKLEVKELTQKLTDMELNELRNEERDTIIAVFGVPPEQMGIVTSSNRATAHESESIMAKGVLIPRLESQREQLQSELVPQYDERLILDYVNPSPEDQDQQLEAMKAASWAPTVGEWRERQGLPNRGEQDNIHLRPMNLVEVEATTTKQLGAKQVKTMTPDHMPLILDSLRPDRIREQIEPIWNEELAAWGQRTLDDLGSDVAFNMLNPKVVKHMESVVGERIVMVNDFTKDQIRETLIAGVEGGEGFRDLAKRVRDVFGEADRVRSERIARTEVVRSASFGSENAWVQSQIVWGKRWLVVLDDQRHDEAGYHNTIAQLGVDFVFTDGNSAPYPGGFGDPGEDINCRCSIGPVVDAPGSETALIVPLKQQPPFPAERLTWMRIAVQGYKRAFRNQQDDLLSVLADIFD
jgi:phage portal protein BeeE